MIDRYLKHLPPDTGKETQEAFKALVSVAILQHADINRDWVVNELKPVQEFHNVAVNDDSIDTLTGSLMAALNGRHSS